MVNSNEKGAAFERKICIGLALWLSDGRRDDLFWRSAMSGGRATLASRRGRRARFAQLGDISAIDALGLPFTQRFLIECKFYQDLRLEARDFGTQGLMPVLWDKPFKEAADGNKTPLCFLKQNRRPIIVWGTAASYRAMNEAAGGRLRLWMTFNRNDVFVHQWLYEDMIKLCKASAILGRRTIQREIL